MRVHVNAFKDFMPYVVLQMNFKNLGGNTCRKVQVVICSWPEAVLLSQIMQIIFSNEEQT